MHRYILPGLLAGLLISCSPKYKKAAAADCTPARMPENSIPASLGLSGQQLETKTAVCSLEDGGESLITRAWLCDNARKTIDIQYYIFSRDNTGLIACDFLVRAANRGVKVRLLVDDVTVKAGSREIRALDSHENIEIRVYNPGVKLGKLSLRVKKIFREFGKVHRRMHNKTLNVDNLAAITGGRNIADEYFDFDKKYNFRDRDVLLLGRAVRDVKSSFELFWEDTLTVPFAELVRGRKRLMKDPERFADLHAYACDTGNFSARMREKILSFPDDFKARQRSAEVVWLENVSFVADVPGKNRDRPGRKGGICTDSLVALIGQAKKSIVIQSPYLILTEEGRSLFRDAVQRGVKVRVLTNSLAATDNHEAFSGYQRDRNAILDIGIDVYEFKPDAAVRYKVMTAEVQAAMSYTPVFGMHAKTMIIDDAITVVGSFNLDPRSANLNTECVAIIRSEQITRNVSRYVEEEFLPENAWRITKEFNPDAEAGKWKQLKMAPRRVIPKKVL